MLVKPSASWLLILAASVQLGCSDATVSSPSSSGQQSLVISELLPPSYSNQTSWIELSNPSSETVPLNGCEITNQLSESVQITVETFIAPQQRLALVFDKANTLPIEEESGVVHLSDQGFQLSPDSDVISLRCNNKSIDTVSYNNYRPRPEGAKRSLQLEPTITDSKGNDLLNNWCYTPLTNAKGADQLSSPGQANPSCLKELLVYSVLDKQSEVLIEGIDFEATMKIAKNELESEYATAELTIWAIRDQKISPAIAEQVSSLYFQYIDGLYDAKAVAMLDWNHAVWHFAWAISNMYRNGDEQVKQKLQLAYEDALTRPATQERFKLIALEHVTGTVVTMGDMHERARDFAQKHIVVPGNPNYVQSYEEYLENKRGDFSIALINVWYNTSTFFADLF